ncbi:MAG: nucleoside kinase [Oscillospiraceae bacterium]|jgi:uridine kinase|nr:nucleoside kinase [Oscillospiraceae bacterium]
MAFELSYINGRVRSDARGFAEECEAEYGEKIRGAARAIAKNVGNSPIVLLSGPSGSGKTTTAKKLDDELGRMGIHSRSVSLDDYFKPQDTFELPKTPEGERDYESPLCIDWELLNAHFDALDRGEEICVPHFSFTIQGRNEAKAKQLLLKKDEVAIFEGIHALNTRVTGLHPEAFKLYVSARSDTFDNGRLAFKGTWTRLVRRVIRDERFRGTGAITTLSMWANVRRGEKAHISPFKDSANLKLDTAMAYEISAMLSPAREIFSRAPDGAERYDELTELLAALEAYDELDPALIPADSMLREFIGGGTYKY